MSTRDMVAVSRRRRPVFLNLARIQMPVCALTSIAHRVTGIFLALGVPFTIYLPDLSLQGPQSYARMTGFFVGLMAMGVWMMRILSTVRG